MNIYKNTRTLATGHEIRCDVMSGLRGKNSKDCGCKNTPFVWVSDKHKYIYFETPKCASLTLKTILPDKEYYYGNIGDIDSEEYFVFGFVRNPWSRMVSNYVHFCRFFSKSRKKRVIEQMFNKKRWFISFDEFIKKSRYIKNHHWEPCYKFLPKDLSTMDLIGKLENFRECMKEIERRIGVSLELIKKNKTDHKSYYNYYNNETKRVVAQMFTEDIRLFNYEYAEGKI